MTSTAVSNVTIHDGKPGSTPSVGNVVIADGRIKSIGVAAASAETVVDATGKHLVPGLIDCHVHLFLNAEPTAIEDFMQADDATKLGWARANSESLVRSGVTTIREIAAPNTLMARLLRDCDTENLPAPRILPAFSNITTSGGHGYFLGVEADSIDALRRAARSQVQSGARFVKIMASGGVMTPTSDPTSVQYSSDQLRAVVEEAAAAGVPCAAHAHSAEAVRNSIEAGITSIEHGTFIDAPTAELMARTGTWLVPTVATLYFVGRNIAHPALPDWAREKVEALRPVFYKHVDAALAAGVRIAAGSDMGIQFVRHTGATLARELAVYVERGMSPSMALASATSQAAELLGISDDVGTIEPGKAADLVLLADDPTDNLLSLSRPETVWQSGRVMSAA